MQLAELLLAPLLRIFLSLFLIIASDSNGLTCLVMPFRELFIDFKSEYSASSVAYVTSAKLFLSSARQGGKWKCWTAPFIASIIGLPEDCDK